MNLHFDPSTAMVTLVAALLLITVRRCSAFIRHWYGKLVNWVLWRASRVVQRGFASRVALKRYAELQLDAADSKHLELPAAFSKVLEVDKAFVPLLLDEGRGGDLTFSHTTLFDAVSRVRVVGDPGSGKSSLVKRVFRDACQEALRSPHDARLPIRIELKDFIPPENLVTEVGLANWAIAQLRGKVAHAAAFDIAEAFDSYADDGGLLVLLDGLDEVPGNAYPRTAAAIRALSARLALKSERSLILLTMREQFHRQVGSDLSSAFPRTLHIRRLTPNDIFRFLTQWPFDDAKAVPAEVNRIYEELTDRPTLRTMCTNPLVLAMYVATDEQMAHTAELPETRSRFYKQVVSELLIRRRARQVGPAPVGVATKRDREAILGRIALQHLLDPDQSPNEIPWASAVQVTCDVLKRDDPELAEAYLQQLSIETGLFTEERERESLRFIHLTFCEYFAALDATDGQIDGWADLIDAHRGFMANGSRQFGARLTEVVPFAAGLLPPKHLDTALGDVAALEDPEILARCFLETQKYDHPSWEPFASDQVSRLRDQPTDQWNQRWLRQLSLLSVVLREAERWTRAGGVPTSALTIEQLFAELVDDDHERLVRVFSSFAAEDPAASLRLAEASGVDLVEARPDVLVEACADPPFLALAIDRAEGEGSHPRAWPRIFGEAALRYQVVAEVLAERDAPASWAERSAAAPREDRWEGAGIRPGKLHAVCLTLGAGEERRGPVTSFPMLKTLSHVASPATLVPDAVLRAASVVCMLGAITGMLVPVFTAGIATWHLILLLGGVTLAYGSGFGITYYRSYRRAVYMRLANLVPEDPARYAAPAGSVPDKAVGGDGQQSHPVESRLRTPFPLGRQRGYLALSERLRSGIARVGAGRVFYRFSDGGRRHELVVEREDHKIRAHLAWQNGRALLVEQPAAVGAAEPRSTAAS